MLLPVMACPFLSPLAPLAAQGKGIGESGIEDT
jgi:hypothetical protein